MQKVRGPSGSLNSAQSYVCPTFGAAELVKRGSRTANRIASDAVMMIALKEKIAGKAAKSARAPPRRGAIAWKGERKVLDRPT